MINAQICDAISHPGKRDSRVHSHIINRNFIKRSLRDPRLYVPIIDEFMRYSLAGVINGKRVAAA